MKRFLKLLPLALLLCLALCLLSSCQEEIEYEIAVVDGGCEIVDVLYPPFKDPVSVLTVPAEFHGLPVVSIGAEAFAYVWSLSPDTIVLPDTVKVIKDGAFEDSDVREIILPAGLESIGAEAFFGCTKLVGIHIPKDTVIGENAFAHCPSLAGFTVDAQNPYYTAIDGSLYTKDGSRLVFYASKSPITSLVIPEGTEKIPDYAFRDCKTLVTIEIPEGVTEIGDFAFSGCTALTSIRIPDSVTEIGNSAFNGCTALTSIRIPEGVTEIGYRAFTDCTALTSITLPEGLTQINRELFKGCTALPCIIIPEAVTTIDEKAFADCTALTSIRIPAGVTDIKTVFPYVGYAPRYNLFDGCTALTDIIVAEENPAYTAIDGSLYSKDGKALLLYSPARKDSDFTVPTGVTIIESGAFYCNSTIKSITLPEGVISIKAYAFYKCRSLRSVSLPSTLLSIEDYAFAHCESLEAIPLPSSLLTIGEYAFFNCDALKRIVIPASVERIDFKAFRKCDGIDIYAEAEKRPDGWHRKFKPIFERVEWGYTGS